MDGFFGRLTFLRRKSKQARATLVQIKLNIKTVKGNSRHHGPQIPTDRTQITDKRAGKGRVLTNLHFAPLLFFLPIVSFQLVSDDWTLNPLFLVFEFQTKKLQRSNKWSDE